MARRCYLENIKSFHRIIIPLSETITIGRDRRTLIEDLSVSRKQIELTVDLKEEKLKLTQIGKAVSGINGFALIRGKTYSVKHDDIIEVKMGGYQFKVSFEPKDEQDIKDPKRAKMDFPIFSSLQKNAEMSTSIKINGNKSSIDMWENVDGNELLIFTPGQCIAQSKIAAFDIDGTIIKTKSGARFPKNADDWEFYLADVKKQLQKVKAEDFKIVFFTNQGGVGKDIKKINEYKRKVENIIKALDVPVQVFVALGKAYYRKPMPGMWQKLINEKNDSRRVDINNSFYVGDAAGREKNWAPKKNKDHSSADRLFALNIGLKFYTPEEFFLKARSIPYQMPEFDPRNYKPLISYPDVSYSKQHVIVMVGGPGSGKSHFCKKHLIPKGYSYVNRDKLGSWQKCVKMLEEELRDNKNVVVDNTNGDVESRKRYIDAAKQCIVDVRCFVMSTSKNQAQHNNKFRELTDSTHMKVSDIIIHSYWKNYKEPDVSEGYADIVKIPFIPDFDSDEHENMYRMFLIDK